MSDRTLTIASLIASIAGLILSIIGTFFTKYGLISLISLLIFENLILLIWWFHIKKRHVIIYPPVHYPCEYETIFFSVRYVFEDANTMEYEAIKAIKVTKPFLQKVVLGYEWSSQGELSIYSESLQRELKRDIEYKFNGATSEITVEYYFPRSCKFGDIEIIHIKMNLKDRIGDNNPVLAQRIKEPTNMICMEAILKYKDRNRPATFSYRDEEERFSIRAPFNKIKDLEFDTKTKSYRVMYLNPSIGYHYKLEWEK